jgi:hypothetical protein
MKKRRQLLINPAVQIKLVLRIAVYWVFFMLATTSFLYAWFALMTPYRTAQATWNDLLFRYGPVAVMTTILVPILMCDMLRLSNRFLGPMYRLQRQMRLAAEGQTVAPVYFRDGDLWQDFANDFNRLLARINAPTNSPAKNSVAGATELALGQTTQSNAAPSQAM